MRNLLLLLKVNKYAGGFCFGGQLISDRHGLSLVPLSNDIFAGRMSFLAPDQ